MLQGINPSRVRGEQRSPKTFGTIDVTLCFDSTRQLTLRPTVPYLFALPSSVVIAIGWSPTTFAVEMDLETRVLDLPWTFSHLPWRHLTKPQEQRYRYLKKQFTNRKEQKSLRIPSWRGFIYANYAAELHSLILSQHGFRDLTRDWGFIIMLSIPARADLCEKRKTVLFPSLLLSLTASHHE
jgi:hypothetical protein